MALTTKKWHNAVLRRRCGMGAVISPVTMFRNFFCTAHSAHYTRPACRQCAQGSKRCRLLSTTQVRGQAAGWTRAQAPAHPASVQGIQPYRSCFSLPLQPLKK